MISSIVLDGLGIQKCKGNIKTNKKINNVDKINLQYYIIYHILLKMYFFLYITLKLHDAKMHHVMQFHKYSLSKLLFCTINKKM